MSFIKWSKNATIAFLIVVISQTDVFAAERKLLFKIPEDGAGGSASASSGVPSGFSILGETQTAPAGYSFRGVLEFGGRDLWIFVVSLPQPRGYTSAAVLNNKLYIVGGSSQPVILDSVFEFDPLLVTGQGRPPLLTGRNSLTAETVNGKIYAIGGSTTVAGSPTDAVEEYTPVTTWISKAPMPTPRYAMASAVLDNKIYVISAFLDFRDDFMFGI